MTGTAVAVTYTQNLFESIWIRSFNSSRMRDTFQAAHPLWNIWFSLSCPPRVQAVYQVLNHLPELRSNFASPEDDDDDEWTNTDEHYLLFHCCGVGQRFGRSPRMNVVARIRGHFPVNIYRLYASLITNWWCHVVLRKINMLSLFTPIHTFCNASFLYQYPYTTGRNSRLLLH